MNYDFRSDFRGRHACWQVNNAWWPIDRVHVSKIPGIEPYLDRMGRECAHRSET